MYVWEVLYHKPEPASRGWFTLFIHTGVWRVQEDMDHRV